MNGEVGGACRGKRGTESGERVVGGPGNTAPDWEYGRRFHRRMASNVWFHVVMRWSEERSCGQHGWSSVWTTAVWLTHVHPGSNPAAPSALRIPAGSSR